MIPGQGLLAALDEQLMRRPDRHFRQHRSLPNTRAACERRLQCIRLRGRKPRPASYAIGCMCPRQASADTLTNHRPFKLREDANHAEHRFAGWRTGIVRLLMQVEIDARGIERAKSSLDKSRRLLEASAEVPRALASFGARISEKDAREGSC
jgi:hypothetical protein